MYKPSYGKQYAIAKAAVLASGSRLYNLYGICETQKTISTRKLKLYLDKLAEDMKLDAIHFRELANKLGT